MRVEGKGTGVADGLDPDGVLRVLRDDGELVRAVAGEVTLEEPG